VSTFVPPRSTPLATATFDCTLDDFVDVTWRSLARSREFWRQQHTITAILATLSAFLLVFLLPNDPPGAAWAAGAAAATAMVVLRRVRLPVHARAGIRRLLRDRHGDGPHACTIDLHDEGLFVRQLDHLRHLPWLDVLTVRELGGDLEIATERSVVVVRDRAFADAAARRSFHDCAHRLAAAGGRRLPPAG
jgi:hypothetical protein